ncbi:MAG: hypothetical protein KKE05_03040 [Nanoarchaeota archaeon]|nr:hypothetical protein [Nanoarchaeota archaeon]
MTDSQTQEPIQETPKKDKVGQEQIHGLIFGEQLSWHSIILDLINSEQLDPWDIDLVVLTNRYLEKSTSWKKPISSSLQKFFSPQLSC